MKKIIALVFVVLILAFPSLFIFALDQIIDAFRWIVFMDNAETGLPLVAEIIVKAVCESVVVVAAVVAGFSSKNPVVKIVSIAFGFLVCIGIYAICKYIVWIAAILSALAIGYLVYWIVRKKKQKSPISEKPLSEEE